MIGSTCATTKSSASTTTRSGSFSPIWQLLLRILRILQVASINNNNNRRRPSHSTTGHLSSHHPLSPPPPPHQRVTTGNRKNQLPPTSRRELSGTTRPERPAAPHRMLLGRPTTLANLRPPHHRTLQPQLLGTPKKLLDSYPAISNRNSISRILLRVVVVAGNNNSNNYNNNNNKWSNTTPRPAATVVPTLAASSTRVKFIKFKKIQKLVGRNNFSK